MAPSVSKFHALPFNCYELGHTWNPSCSKAAVDIGFHCFKESFKIYTSCYVVSLCYGRIWIWRKGTKDSRVLLLLLIVLQLSLLASKRYPKSREEALRMLKDVTRSAAFLSVNGFGFVFSFCLIRKILGHFNFLSVGYLPAFLGSYAAILVEKPHRRSLLALYVTNVASETLFRMLRARYSCN